ncbi:hypothetical protein [Roseibium limicola]|nr:hypothetical protein [Roseibium limicola]
MGWPLYTGLTAGGVLIGALALALWAQTGENLFVTRILSAIAGCF